MTISMSSASLPIYTSMLSNLSYLLDKAQTHADTQKIDVAALTQFRLAPDMLPFTSQVVIACDVAKNGVARMSGLEAPKFEDNETTLAHLKARIEKTLAWLATVPAAALDGCEDKDITFPVGPEATRTMKGEAFLKYWSLPNFFFHTTVAYAMLRHNGVELGKRDFLLGNRA
jgi:uncharacterized protein